VIIDEKEFIRRVYESDNGPIRRKFQAFKKKGTITNGKNGNLLKCRCGCYRPACTELYYKLKKENMEHED
jgi:hypothetical protein